LNKIHEAEYLHNSLDAKSLFIDDAGEVSIIGLAEATRHDGRGAISDRQHECNLLREILGLSTSSLG
jgi:hypothetical protein